MLDAAIKAGGYPYCNGNADGAGFDLIFGGHMRQIHGEPQDVTAGEHEPTYLYRWFTAGKNGSAYGAAHMLEHQGQPEHVGNLNPLIDEETLIYLRQFGY